MPKPAPKKDKRVISDLLNVDNIVQMPSTATVREAGREMTDKNVGSILVIDDGKLHGIFTERDALRVFVATRRNADWTTLAQVMNAAPRTVGPETEISKALTLMKEGGFRHLPVVDGEKVLGVVSYRRLLFG